MTILALIIAMMSANASDVTLVVKQIDNSGLVPGNTYRLYAKVSTLAKSIHAIFGAVQNSLIINSSAAIWQSDLGGYSAGNVNEEFFTYDPALQFDSWFTLGFENNEGSDLWDLGMDFSAFENGTGFSADNGAWFLLTTNERCFADEDGLLLLAQFTTSGVVSGTLNVQGWEGPQNSWQERGLTFSTEILMNANEEEVAIDVMSVLTEVESEEMVAEEISNSESEVQGVASSVMNAMSEDFSFEIFPNPNNGETINVALSNASDVVMVLNITDVTGKLVHSENILPLQQHVNMTFNGRLSAGMCNVSVGSLTEKLIVQ